MKLKKSIFYIITVTVLLALTFGTAMADDSVIFRRNISKTPAGETEYASISFMRFAVPAQAADGTLVDLTLTYESGTNESPVPIYEGTSTIINTAKPLVASYIDEEQVEETLLSGNEIMGGLVIGEFDGFVAHSLDDGATWKTTNVSESAEKSSFNLQNGTAYPGAVYGMVQSTIGNRVMAAWLSRYCDEGSPLYTLVGDSTDAEDVAYKAYLQNDSTYNLSDLYVTDIWSVAGAQKSVDFTLQGFPEVGEIPYGCVWTARGTLIATGTAMDSTGATVETHDIVWSKPERLTSGVRDPNRLEIDGVDGAGFAITWQEDPEGLRPGLGLGPGEGWSGAIVNAKTDIWYSYIDWDHFNLVDTDGDYTTLVEPPMTIETYFDQDDDGMIDEDLESNKPKVAIPMAMPMRLTDNNMCKASTSSDPTKVSPAYCYVDFDLVDDAGEVDLPDALPISPAFGSSDLCTESMAWATPGGSTINVCKTEDGRYLNGRVGASRARMTLQPYTKADGTPGAWFIMAYEESKALGEYTIIDGDDTSDPIEIGKNIWYHTFDMLEPEFASQGAMLNQPTRFNPEFAFDETLGASADLIGAWNGDFLTLTDEWGYIVYQTEIARRFSMIAQPVSKIGETRTSAYLLYKQGILNQGGPADIFARRIVVPPADDPATTDIVEGAFNSATDNPYAYENMVCEDDPNTTLVEGWIIEPGLVVGEEGYNPNYIEGLCGANATNLSGNTIEALDFSTTECYNPADPTACAAIFPWGGDISDFPKVETWSQSGYDQNGVASDPYAEQVEGAGRTFNSNLDDQSWEDPFDVAKGHRGFLDGDFLYIMYAWSPNWKANSVGNDKYNLYGRRSFDGGATWTTTPSLLGGVGLESTDAETDDPSLCENYGIGGQAEDITKVCYSYPAGGFEQARNVSQLTGTKVTILDPRYTPSGGPKKFTLLESYTTSAGEIFDYDIPAFDYLEDGTLARDPSKLFVVFETGDNTTAAEGEPTPLDLYYSRGTVYGDYYEWVTEDWLPVEDVAFTTTDEYRWNWLEKNQDDLSGEAALTANPSGDFLYADWSQWCEDEYENVFDSDIWFSRMFYNDEVATAAVVSIENATLLPPLFDTDLELILTASAVDYDRFGDGLEIVEYEWSVDGVVLSGKTDSHFNAPPRTLSNGWHDFSVRAKDNDGQWSRPFSVRILIVEDVHTVFLPMMKR